MDPLDLSYKYDLDYSPSEMKAALQTLEDQTAFILGVSGKICSGKDTVAPMIMDELGFKGAKKLSFADDLKLELSRIIEIIHEANTPRRAHNDLLRELKPKVGPHDEIIRILYNPVKDGRVIDGHSRGPEFREAIQLWGSNIRRAEDDNYWVKKTISNVIDTLTKGQSIYISDARFVNEAESITDIGGALIRLDVSPEEQLRRIVARDGKEPNMDTLVHMSETSLDDYDFPLRIAVDNHTPSEIVEIALAA